MKGEERNRRISRCVNRDWVVKLDEAWRTGLDSAIVPASVAGYSTVVAAFATAVSVIKRGFNISQTSKPYRVGWSKLTRIPVHHSILQHSIEHDRCMLDSMMRFLRVLDRVRPLAPWGCMTMPGFHRQREEVLRWFPKLVSSS
jgi:hypothetical protein